MTISNELTSDILAALVQRENRSKHELNELKDLLFAVHSVLQEMGYEQRKTRWHDPLPPYETGRPES
jgi:hypothetical protein